MKDVGILTKYYKNYNYGGMLQGYALYNVIKNLGYSVDIISYDVRENSNSVYPSLIQQIKQYGISAIVPKVAEKIIAKGGFFIKDLIRERIELFDRFEAEAKGDTELYNDDSINKLKRQYKVFVSGSDQIWNPNAVRNLYLQTFVSEPYRKISYAASVGRNSFSDYEAGIMAAAVEKFGCISVRENTAKELLQKYINQPITTVLDPTLLLSAEDWSKVSEKRLIKENYALVYFFSESIKVRKKAQQFCRERGLELVVIPYAKQEFNLTDYKGPGKKMERIGPREFISLIKYADFVFTDSFHGAVFALIHQIPFVVFERNKSGHVSMNSRLYDLLDLFQEKKRLVNVDVFNCIEALTTIDSIKIRKIICERKKQSIDFLLKAIKTGCQEYHKQVEIKTILGREDECSGCGGCVALCPKKCISLGKDKNGFLVPVINTQTCIECGLCKNVCPMQNYNDKHIPVKTYAAYSKKAFSSSTSGGLGYTIGKRFIENCGIVYGAAYADKFKVRMVRTDSLEALSLIQGTKYVQADMTGVIENILMDLEGKKEVLFTGTPCQVAGVLSVAKSKKLEKKLTTIEIVCHGTPSQKMFDDYLNWAQQHYESQVIAYSFRAKENDRDKDFMLNIVLADSRNLMVSGLKDPYYKAFLSTHWFRESCYSCPFATKERVADITLGDFWNAETLPNDFGKDRRISVVVLNTHKGEVVLKDVQDNIELQETSWEVAAQGNANLYRATRKFAGYVGYGEAKRDFFEKEYNVGIDLKKYILNQLPIATRRTIKKISKH